MACEAWQDQLAAYLDGELSPSEAGSVGGHLRQCAGCAADAMDRVRLQRAVAVAGRRYAPSAEFRAKIMASVSTKQRAGRAWLWQLVLVPAALVILLSVGMSLYVGRVTSERARVYGELADLHVATLASSTPVDVISTDRHTVKPWFEGKLPFTFNLPELQGTDFTLRGGRVTYLGQAPGAQLIYRIRKHELSVFIFQDRGGDASISASKPLPEFSFNVEGWAKNGLRYFVVGDVGAEDIEALSKILRDAQ
jgi:anti-sigma factor RsiW